MGRHKEYRGEIGMNYNQYLEDYWPEEEDKLNIDEPLEEIPFSSFTHRLGDKNIESKINNETSIFGLLRRNHFYGREADRFWNRELRKEDNNESEHDLQGGEMPPSA